MGRRSINTTKSGKYMNPTDQARKEARKKELKKNKKQRQMVRAAVLKGKDPMQIIEEMEKIDQMEFNVLQPSPLNEKVLKDKRKKLRETLDRVLKMYNKDDPEKWVELKRSQAEYERRRNQLVAFYESVKHAQQVSVDEIPLPSIQVPEHISSMYNSTSQIPLPNAAEGSSAGIIPISGLSKPPPSILKRTTAYGIGLEKEPPGVPPGPPPDLSSCSEDDDDAMETDIEIRTTKQLRFSDDVSVSVEADEDGQPLETGDDESSSTPSISPSAPKSKPTSLQQRMVALSGQNIDEFMKEMEAVHKNKDTEPTPTNPENIGNPRNEESNKPEPKSHQPETMAPPGTDPLDIPHTITPSIPPPAMLFRPQMNQIPRPVMPLMSMRLPPGPPPGRPNLPPGPPPGLPPRLGMRLPPGPPPGIPPRMLRLPIMPPNAGNMPMQNAPAVSGVNPNVLSAAPQLINRTDGGTTKQGATIMAKPQIRNLSADVTRFVPSALRVKREDKKSKSFTRQMLVNELKQQEIVRPASGATKDDAYMQFMREMEGLL